RRATIDSSSIAGEQEPLYLAGACSECGPEMQAALHGDTITLGTGLNFDYWLEAFNADTVLIDRTVVQFPDTYSVYINSNIQANDAIVTRSQFLHLGGGNFFNFNGLRLFVDSVTATACAAVNCDQATVFNPSSGEGGPQLQSLTLQRSHFTQIGYPISASTPGL